MDYWTAPRLWEGETVAIIATGHSINQADVDFCRGKCKTLVINTSIQLAPWADALYFADNRWFDGFTEDVLAFKGLKVSIENAHMVRQKDPDVKIMRNAKDVPGLCMEPDGLHTGRNSGYQGINLAVHLGVKRIVLLGFDCHADGPKRWWFKEYPWGSSGPQIYRNTFLPRFKTLKEPLDALGIEVINCSMGSAIDWWQKRGIRDVFGSVCV